MPRKADPIIGNPNDPKGMIALLEQYLEWRQVRNYAERTIGCSATTFATSSTGVPCVASPSPPR